MKKPANITDDCGNIAVASVAAMKFADAANGDYHVQRRSPLREKGAMLSWMTEGAADLDGNPRVVSRYGVPLSAEASALPDIGCYECQRSVPGFNMSFR